MSVKDEHFDKMQYILSEKRKKDEDRTSLERARGTNFDNAYKVLAEEVIINDLPKLSLKVWVMGFSEPHSFVFHSNGTLKKALLFAINETETEVIAIEQSIDDEFENLKNL